MQLQSVNDDSRIKSLLEKHFILTDWVAIVGWSTFTSLVFESTFLVKYDTASAITGDDSTISSIEKSRQIRSINGMICQLSIENRGQALGKYSNDLLGVTNS
jgi:hypothetical protein